MTKQKKSFNIFANLKKIKTYMIPLHNYSYPYMAQLEFSSRAFILLVETTTLRVKLASGKLNWIGLIWKSTHIWGKGPSILRSFYTCTVESILTGCIAAWFGKQHRWQPQGSAKGRANCPPHCWRWASLPPGHLHQAVYKESPEDYQWLQPPVTHTALSAALRKTSPQHPIPH